MALLLYVFRVIRIRGEKVAIHAFEIARDVFSLCDLLYSVNCRLMTVNMQTQCIGSMQMLDPLEAIVDDAG